MNRLIARCGQAVGLVGVLLMVVSVASRLAGNFHLGGFSTGTLMLAGIGAVSVGCFVLLWSLAERTRP